MRNEKQSEPSNHFKQNSLFFLSFNPKNGNMKPGPVCLTDLDLWKWLFKLFVILHNFITKKCESHLIQVDSKVTMALKLCHSVSC